MTSVLVALVGAAAVVTLTLAFWLPMRRRELVLRRRIDGSVIGAASRPRSPAFGLAARLRQRSADMQPGTIQSAVFGMVERRIARAQIALTPGELLVAVMLLSATAFALATALEGPIPGVGAAVVVPLMALLFLAQRAAAIQRRFAEQLSDTVSLLANSIRAGHSVQQGLEQVSHDAPEPTRSAFSLAVRELGLGASMEDALARLLERYPSEDMELITTAINVHSVIGGSLVKILETTAGTIRERNRMNAEIKSLTSQQRYSAYVLALLPVTAFVGLRFLSPEYANELLKPGALRIAFFAACGLVVFGFLIMRGMAAGDD
jgi:tight adherence protein B